MENPMAQNEPKGESWLYFDVSTQERDSAIRYILGSIINARNQANFPSNYATFDEDVNIYLAHLLFAMSLPEYHEMAEPYLSMETSDVLQMVRQTEDRTIRYFIFKVNADHMMVHTAVFDDLGKKSPFRFFTRPAQHYQSLAKLYYDQAAAYHRRIYRKQTGIGEVLEKMSRYFDQYQNVLRIARRDYFNFINHFRDQAFSQFMSEVHDYESETLKKVKLDSFLDVYAKWLETKDPVLEPQIQRLVNELKYLDPSFAFEFPIQSREKQGNQHEKKCA